MFSKLSRNKLTRYEVKKMNLISKCAKVAARELSSFADWSNTKEGHEYWHEVYEKLVFYAQQERRQEK